jgi:hypothetical protein
MLFHSLSLQILLWWTSQEAGKLRASVEIKFQFESNKMVSFMKLFSEDIQNIYYMYTPHSTVPNSEDKIEPVKCMWLDI